HLRFLKAVRNAGLSATVSARALASLFPMPGSLAQEGMRPHLSIVPSRSPRFGSIRTARTGCDGAMLYRGAQRGRDVEPPMSSAILTRLVFKVKRPHMIFTLSECTVTMSPVQVRRVDQYASRLDDLQAAPAETPRWRAAWPSHAIHRAEGLGSSPAVLDQ